MYTPLSKHGYLMKIPFYPLAHSHEVRNPLAAAISASEFVASTMDEISRTGTAPREESLALAVDDVHLTLQSLHFVNDFLVRCDMYKRERGPT